jgi:HK97 gp10 family phage protein
MAIGFNTFKGRSRSVQIKITGLKEIQAGFDKMAKTSDDFLTRQIHIAATGLAKRANRDVPVDTGKLLNSIKVIKDRSGARVEVQAKYAGFVEEGTRNMRAQPYIYKHIPTVMATLMANIKRFTSL